MKFPSGAGDNPAEPVTPKRTITITVKDDDSDKIEGATVQVGTNTATTDSNGVCTFENIEDGAISISVSATGYTSQSNVSRTVSESTTSFIITLTASTPSEP